MAINYGVLIICLAAFVLGHDTRYRLHSRWFQLSVASRVCALEVSRSQSQPEPALTDRCAALASAGASHFSGRGSWAAGWAISPQK